MAKEYFRGEAHRGPSSSPEERDGNQEDARAQEMQKLSKTRRLQLQLQQSSDWSTDESHEQQHATDVRGPTALEALLDLELDLHLPSAAAMTPFVGNQFALCDASDELPEDINSVSLELLALQSPHGENQQWQTEDEKTAETPPFIKLSDDLLIHPEVQSPHAAQQPTTKESMDAPRLSMALPPDLMSPTEHVPSFPPSPCQPATGEDYDLASPMALPETSSQLPTAVISQWDLAPPSPRHDKPQLEDERSRPSTVTPFRSVQRLDRRMPRALGSRTAATPNSRTHRNSIPPGRATPRIPRSPQPERRSKVRHGGIYSLLLKNKAMDQEPVLVNDRRRSDLPEELGGARSVSKMSPPPTSGKQHGGIYRALRRGTDTSISAHTK